MLKIFKFADHGHSKNDWLDSRFHFSFAEYHNPDRMGFETLRVINDDIIKAGSGFDFHPHKDMEIITYVRRGAIIHQDSMGNEGRTSAGDVQVMSAGTGLLHAEKSDPALDTQLFQIWIRPRERGVKPRWDQRTFPKDPVMGALNLLVSGRAEDAGQNALMIHQDAAIYGGRMQAGTTLTHTLHGPAYIVMSDGMVRVNGMVPECGDGVEIREEDALVIHADQDAELLLIAL